MPHPLAALTFCCRPRSAIAMALASLILGLLGEPAMAETELDAWIRQQMASARVPGLSAVVVRDQNVVWSGQYGFRDTASRAKVEPETPFLVASVSKLVTATALMQLFDAGAFQLDDPVDPHLPFTFRHPRDPSTPITFRQLLLHLGSIDDNWSVLEPLIVDGDSPLALGDFLYEYFAPIGEHYDAAANFRATSPGAGYFYSNVGYALVGYLVERLAGMPFDRYCRDHLFTPLGMLDSGWFLDDFPSTSVLARPHRSTGGGYSPVAHYGFPDYPNGQLRASAADMATFMLLHLGDGAWRGQRVLETDTARLMRRITHPGLAADQGLGFYWDRASGRAVVGHNGGEVGAYADLFLDPQSGIGVVVIANADPANPGAMWAIVERLFADAPGLGGLPYADGFEDGLGSWSTAVGSR